MVIRCKNRFNINSSSLITDRLPPRRRYHLPLGCPRIKFWYVCCKVSSHFRGRFHFCSSSIGSQCRGAFSLNENPLLSRRVIKAAAGERRRRRRWLMPKTKEVASFGASVSITIAAPWEKVAGEGILTPAHHIARELINMRCHPRSPSCCLFIRAASHLSLKTQEDN